MEPVSNLGKLGRFLLLLTGIVLLFFGGLTVVNNMPPQNMGQCNAVITGFSEKNESSAAEDTTETLVSFNVNGKSYKDIPLGQYEISWHVGDEITVLYNKNDPNDISTKTMTYGGWIVILFSLPFIVIGIYTLVTIRRKAARTPEEIAEDEERTTQGKLKYKSSSIFISLTAGIPLISIGIIFIILEHNPIFGILSLVLGAGAAYVGIRSIIIYFIIKNRNKSLSDDIPNESKE